MLNEILHTLLTLFDEPEAKAHRRIIAEHLWQRPYHAIVLEGERHAGHDVANEWQRISGQLQCGVPIQLALGEAFFYGRPFSVTSDTLIPRRETEELVYHALRRLRPNGQVLDLGAGSGCIAITLKLEAPACQVEAIDISPAALRIAQANAHKHEARIAFRHVDMLRAAENPHEFWQAGLFDLIISNPPYIPLREQQGMSPRVLHHEPHAALFVPDDDPLLFYRAIVRIAKHTLRANGFVACECHEILAGKTLELFQTAGYLEALCLDDAQDKPRFIIT